ncbi:MAG: Zn-ribbon domain-containing OB-fold protein [Bacillota bacterium]
MTYTVIRVAPEGYKAPYMVAMVETEEGPRLIGNLEGIDIDSDGNKIIGRKVTIGHRVIAPGNYTAGEGVAITFRPE